MPFLYFSSQNYDESKVRSYTLPLLFKDNKLGTKNQLENWQNKRRAETLNLFEENIYEQMPKAYDNIYFHKINENQSAMDGKATLKQIDIQVFKNQKSVTIHLVLYEPQVSTKTPIFLLINHRGKEISDPSQRVLVSRIINRQWLCCCFSNERSSSR